MALDANDFTRLGSAAADALASKGIPLAETIDKMASDNDMGLEQIKRLCEAANNASFKAFFDRSAPTDRQATFKVAAAEDVIARRREKTASDAALAKVASFDAEHERRPLSKAGYAPVGGFFDTSSGAFSKIADAPAPYVDPLEQKMLEKRAAADAVVQKGEAERMRSYLEETASAARFKYASAVDEIATYFRRLGPDWAPARLEEFEKTAASVHGAACAPVLKAVRELLPYGEFPEKEVLAEAPFHAVTQSFGPLTTKLASALGDLDRVTKAGAILSTPGAIEAAVAREHSKTAGLLDGPGLLEMAMPAVAKGIRSAGVHGPRPSGLNHLAHSLEVGDVLDSLQRGYDEIPHTVWRTTPWEQTPSQQLQSVSGAYGRWSDLPGGMEHEAAHHDAYGAYRDAIDRVHGHVNSLRHAHGLPPIPRPG